MSAPFRPRVVAGAVRGFGSVSRWSGMCTEPCCAVSFGLVCALCQPAIRWLVLLVWYWLLFVADATGFARSGDIPPTG